MGKKTKKLKKKRNGKEKAKICHAFVAVFLALFHNKPKILASFGTTKSGHNHNPNKEALPTCSQHVSLACIDSPKFHVSLTWAGTAHFPSRIVLDWEHRKLTCAMTIHVKYCF